MLSQERKQQLQQAKNLADNISNLLTKIISGECNQSDAARVLGITPQEFSRNISCNFVHYYKKPQLLSQITSDEIQMLLESPYDKLLRRVFNITDNPGYFVDYEMSEKIPDIMKQALTEREFHILTFRYGLPFNDIDIKPHTLEEIAIAEHVNKERIRQLESKALRKLRNPQYIYSLFPESDLYITTIQEHNNLKEMNQWLDNEIARLSKINPKLKKEIANKEKLVEALKDSNASIEEINNTLLEQNYIPDATYLNPPNNTKIETLDFSNSLLNLLRRNGIFTIGDIKTKTWKDLRQIYYLGDRKLKDLYLTLFKYGIILKSE